MKDPQQPPGAAKPDKIKRWMRILGVVAVLLLLVDLVYTPHFHADVESGGGLVGFYGLYAFLGIVVLVLGAKALRLVVMRPEDYYDE